MRTEILTTVKSAYSQYGLKSDNLEKIVTAIESRLSAAGTIEPENLQTAINEAVELYRPALALIQSEVDSRSKKPPEPTPVPPPATDEPEWAKTLRLQVESLSKDKEAQSKSQTKQDITAKAIALAKKSGATNEALLQKAIKLADFSDDMTPEKLSGLAVAEYNELQSSISKDSAVPIIPVLGDKEAIELAQKKGVEAVDRFLGVKPKSAQ